MNADLERAVGDVVTKRSRVMPALRFLPLGLMVAFVFVTYGAIVWTLRRGFDLDDEAFVYTMIASNRFATDVPLGFQHLLHPLYNMTGQSVLAFRVLRLVGYVLLSVALVACARAIVRRIGIGIPRSGWVFILLIAQVGTFLAWSYPPRALGYNELTSWFVQLGVALIVLSLSWGVSSTRDQGPSWALWSIWAALGGLTTLLVFAKVTSAFAFGVILGIALVIPNPNLRLWKRVVSVGAGATAVTFVLWMSGSPTVSYVKNAFALLFDQSAQSSFRHPMSLILSNYQVSLLSTGRAVVPVLLIFALAMATFRQKARAVDQGGTRGWVQWVTWILGALLLIALIALPKIDAFAYLGTLIAFIGLAGIVGLAVLGGDGVTMRGSTVRRSLSVAVGGSAIVSAPFISAAGTNNWFTGQFVWAATLWAVVLGIALVLLTQRATLVRSNARSLPALIGCGVILLAALAVKAHIATPYRTAPLLSQGTSTSVPELRGLLLTETDAAWFDWISAAGDSLGADDIPATATRVPGALYAFNHSGYASPWVGSNLQAAHKSLRVACKKDPPSDLFVLEVGSPALRFSTANVKANLAPCGINFPGDFRVVAEHDSKDRARAMTIWRLKNGLSR